MHPAIYAFTKKFAGTIVPPEGSIILDFTIRYHEQEQPLVLNFITLFEEEE